MRIISGKWKSRRLYSVRGTDTRPTSDRVKEAVFNVINDRLENSIVLDIFAGTGSMGFEALSRGGDRAVFIERDIRATKVILDNARMLGCEDIISIIKKDVFRAIEELPKYGLVFDVIFLDPPYKTNMEEDVISSIIDRDIIAKHGIIVVEHDIGDIMPDKINIFNKIETRKYGNTGISFYTRGDF